jgi:uncharacterized membrane protein YdjX (TVP38/TMEM64 family)
MLKKVLPPLLALGLVAAALHSLQLDWGALFRGDIGVATSALRAAAERQGPLKALVVTLMIALLPFAMVPITLLLISAAVALGPAAAFAAILGGSTLNTALSFAAGHFWGRQAIEALGLERFKLMQALKDGAQEHGFRMALVSRCMPVPFCLPGIAAAVVGIGFWQMLLGTLAMMLPWAVLYVFFTEAIRSGEARFLAPALAVLALISIGGWWLRRKAGGDPVPAGPLSPQSPALGPELTLYTLAGNEACQDARRELWRLRPRLKFEVRELDLASNGELMARFQDHAPLLFMGEQKLFSFQVDENALESYLKAKRD